MVLLKSSKEQQQKKTTWRKTAMKKIRMVVKVNGEIAYKKFIDLENKIIKERNEENKEVISYNFDGIVKDFGSIEKYVDYNKRVWGFQLV
jgi:ADP-glucose pyrophosphorylase